MNGVVTMSFAGRKSGRSSPRSGAGYWPEEYADRNRAVANQCLTGSNARWKWATDYSRRSIAEAGMAMLAGMPESVRVA